MYPEDLKYTAEHEWVEITPDGTARFGITDYAQDALGDIVFVTLPEPGVTVAAGDPCGEVESTKSVSDVYAPVSGEVVARNEALETAPETGQHRPLRRGLDRSRSGWPTRRRSTTCSTLRPTKRSSPAWPADRLPGGRQGHRWDTSGVRCAPEGPVCPCGLTRVTVAP